jgi:chromosome segregation protein
MAFAGRVSAGRSKEGTDLYLRSIELVGFKSFPDCTKLEFEPGLTAIVGPNGCGKSNVADAVRWALGEQSAKALRGTSMEDVIFTGTDIRKPLGSAEVNLTFQDCEKILGTEFNEVTVTRRVFRSGEGQYFINKTPCRLKDIQRLFMDTGIGTTSYSLMEQGRIDQVLSSRPEDRREIFEEASGITRFKADKREALRKLEQTEANLLRLSDVLREVKRQIGSLQRQAGKARRFKALREELKKLDIFATQQRVIAIEEEIRAQEEEVSRLGGQIRERHQEIQSLQEEAGSLRRRFADAERAIEKEMQAGMDAQAKLARANDLIRTHRERISDLQRLTERDECDVREARTQIDKCRQSLTSAQADLTQAEGGGAAAETELKQATAALAEHERKVDELREQIQELRDEAVEQESRHSNLQNELAQLESRDRSNVLRRERLLAEQSQLSQAVEQHRQRVAAMEAGIREIETEAARSAAALDEQAVRRSEKARELEELRDRLGKAETETAVKRLQRDLLADEHALQSEGHRLVLDKDSPLRISRESVLGPLGSLIEVEREYRAALSATLQLWLDAVVVAGDAPALEILAKLQAHRGGSARLLAAGTPAGGPESVATGPGSSLLDHVRCEGAVQPLIRRILAGVRVVESLQSVPLPVPRGTVFVTREGAVVRGDGFFEFHMPGGDRQSSLERRETLRNLDEDLGRAEREKSMCERALAERGPELAALDEAVDAARSGLNDVRQSLAVKQGEFHIIAQEKDQAARRLETVTWELHGLDEQGDSTEEERDAIIEKITALGGRRTGLGTETETATRELHALEGRRAALYSQTAEQRVKYSEFQQRVERLRGEAASLENRLAELGQLVATRSQGIASYGATAAQLETAVREAEDQIPALKAGAERSGAKLEELRKSRDRQFAELNEAEKRLAARRDDLEALHTSKGELDVRHAEARMKRQNLLDRAASDYGIPAEGIMQEAEPAWETGRPDRESLETQIVELRAKIEAMGPVNLVAIEEYQELEERYEFLTQQQNDLVNAKAQLVEMIRKINVTTSEMFTQTFARINENFQSMFRTLFNGGTAKLVLVNEEDVLESGIEIIARPPGKCLQNVSLLSGGERTLTAVALLFSIYLIKPSPFCMLDELDAALDESNIERFVKVLQGFLAQSQFIVITHNRRTIAAASVLYGVTMEERGVSKIVSMKFSPADEAPGRTPRPQPEAVAVER